MSSRSRAKGVGRVGTGVVGRLGPGSAGPPHQLPAQVAYGGVPLGSLSGAGAEQGLAGGVPPSHEGWAETWLSAEWCFPFGGPKVLSPRPVPPW